MRLRNDFFEHGLGAAARVISAHPWTVIASYLTAAVASVVASVLWLEFHTDQNDLVSNELEYNRRFLEFRREFGDLEYLYVVIEVKDLARAKAIADAVASELEALSEHVSKVFHRVDVDPRSAFVFVPREAIAALAEELQKNDGIVRSLLSVRDLDDVARFARRRLESMAGSEAGDGAGSGRTAELGLSALRAFVDGLASTVDGDAPRAVDFLSFCPTATSGGRSTFERLLAGGMADDAGDIAGNADVDVTELLTNFCGGGYLYTGDLLFLRVLPKKDFATLEVIREPLREIRAALSRVRARFPGSRLGLTGRPVLQADEMETTSTDMTRAAILATLGVLALFIIFFREIRRPTLAAIALVSSLALTFGVVTVTLGHLNLLTMVFAVMLVSMGMEFGIHLISRYQEELSATSDVPESIRNALMTAGKGNITGAATTAAAFFMTLFVDFKGLRELGFIAGTGLLICMVTMNTMLPAMLVLLDRRRKPGPVPAPLRMGFLGALATRPSWTLPLFAIITLALAPFASRVSFNANLLELQARGLTSVEYEELILDTPGIKTWFAAFMLDSLTEVREVTAALEREEYADVVGKVESILDYVPDDQDEKIELVRALAARVAAGANGDGGGVLPWRVDHVRPVDVEALGEELEALLERLELYLSALLRRDTGEDGDAAAAALEELTNRLDALLVTLEEDPERASARLTELSRSWAGALESVSGQLAVMLDPVPTRLEELDPLLKQRVISSSGRYLVHAYPREDIWNEENMAEFVEVTRAVREDVTGVPVQVFESTKMMKRGFVVAALYSIIAVFILILIDFRSIVFTLLAMIPVVLGLIWVGELMPLLGMEFNLANFFSIPILIGEGINGGVHIIHRFREDRSARVATRSTGTAVALSYLNTLAGFGMLLLARHQGLATLGGMMVLGSAASLVSSTLVLPAILKLVERRRWHAERE